MSLTIRTLASGELIQGLQQIYGAPDGSGSSTIKRSAIITGMRFISKEPVNTVYLTIYLQRAAVAGSRAVLQAPDYELVAGWELTDDAELTLSPGDAIYCIAQKQKSGVELFRADQPQVDYVVSGLEQDVV